MKRLIIIMILMSACSLLNARPKEMGIRAGAGGFEAAYQHGIRSTRFIEADLGMDMGYNSNGRPGVKATATYDFIWAQPSWTSKGIWSIYTGPGISFGYVDDMVPYYINGRMNGFCDNGFMIGFVINIGVEYMFTAPFSITFDVRPCIGIHINDGRFRIPETSLFADYGGKTGFYDNGVLGFIPSISLRYRF